MKRQPYPTDISDTQWAVLEPEIPAPRPGGRPRKTDLREVANAIFYLTHEGCTWRALPHDFPRWKTVYNYFYSRRNLTPRCLACHVLACDFRATSFRPTW